MFSGGTRGEEVRLGNGMKLYVSRHHSEGHGEICGVADEKDGGQQANEDDLPGFSKIGQKGNAESQNNQGGEPGAAVAQRAHERRERKTGSGKERQPFQSGVREMQGSGEQ